MKVFKPFFLTSLLLLLSPVMLFSQTMKNTGHPYKDAFDVRAASIVETQNSVSGAGQIAQVEMERVQQPEQIAPRHRENDMQPWEREQAEERRQVEMERKVQHERFPEQRKEDARPVEGGAPPGSQLQTFGGYLPPQMEDPLGSYVYLLEVGGKSFGHFTTCSGIGSITEIAKQKVVNKQGQQVIKKVPGSPRWLDITLKRGLSPNMSVWQWRQQVVTGDINATRKNFSIVLLNQKGGQVARWNFSNGWPSKVEALNSREMPPIETLVITHEGMKRIQ
jgi:phage tail-like protein